LLLCNNKVALFYKKGDDLLKIKYFIFLCIFSIVLSITISLASSSINLGINDSIVTPPKNIPPVFIDNICYVPVDVFSQNFIISYSYDDISKTITLIRGNSSLSFNMRQNIAIDSDKNVYFYTCYYENNTFMVPARLICDVFGLKYSYLTTINTVRIRMTAANLSDNQFVDQFKNILNPPVIETPDNPDSNNDTENIVYKNIYLMLSNQPNSYTLNVLSTLNNTSSKATFFATKDNISTYPAVLFDIFVSGHSLGIDMTGFDNINTESTQTLISYADDTNTLFMKVLKTKFNALLFTQEQASAFTAEQRSAITSAGYKIWTPNIVTQVKSQTPATANIIYNTTNQISRQNYTIKLLTVDTENSYNALSSIINYCNENNTKFYTITPTKKP
jgi:hypothetical protein